MKKFFAIVLAATMTLGLAAVASAQDAGPGSGRLQGKQRGGGMRVMMKIQKEALDELKLTGVQKKAIADLDKKNAEEMKELMQKAKDTGKPDRDAMKKLRQEHMDGLRDILGGEKFRDFRELMMKKMKEYRDAHPDMGGKGDRRGKNKDGDKGKGGD